MSIQQNDRAIRTTHVGSLPRPTDVLDQMKAKLAGLSYDAAGYERRIRAAVADIVAHQAALGIDVVSDGELPKPGFFTYVRERLDGFEPRPQLKLKLWEKEVDAFPEYYEQYFKQAMLGGTVQPFAPLVCVGPVRYRGEAAVQRDIENLKAAVAVNRPYAAFMPATAPSGVGLNQYYKSEEEYFHAVGAAMRAEYKAIVDAGLLLQVDDPFIPDIFVDPHLDAAAMRRRAEMYVESINEALAGIPPERVRFHTCYGINHGPRLFEAANPRHEHEYHIWESVKLPAGKVLIPGVITHCSNIVEHPELIAERLLRFARLVGRENVMAGADCGFSSQATYHPEIHPKVVWAKFEAMRDGARIATKQLWGAN